MKWKKIMAIATIFALYAIMHSITPPTSADSSIPALPINPDGDALLQALTGRASGTPSDEFISILLANNAYPRYEYDFQAIESSAPDMSSGTVENERPSHLTEPASMLLIGAVLVGVAVFGRKLKKNLTLQRPFLVLAAKWRCIKL